MSTDNDMFAALADELKILAASPRARATFRHGGHYSVPHPAVPKEDVIVLNTVFWTPKYQALNKHSCHQPPDAAREITL